ncbi:MAG: PQQ-dependent sugar dehydrogenase [Actinobacteria bacterium]|nr:MAG: PQQ-dependent sugar dehydrogenase [Actinomycetota bacterium]
MRRRTNVRTWIRLTGAAAMTAALAWSPATPAQGAPAIRAKLVVGSLNVPTAFTFGPGNRIWYVEKATGEIRIHDLGTGSDSLFDTVPGVNADGERGMLGIALDPGYPTDPYVYVYATRSVSGALENQILRLTDSGGMGTNRTVILSTPASSSPYHNGGRILFGPDGMLYAIVGEGHNPANAQDTSQNDRGKILRMTPSGGVPSDNPFANSRIFAYGIRNSFGFAFDPRKNRLWETENGPSCNDELNLIRKGANYGWGPNETCSGSSPANTNQDGPNPVRPKRWYTPTIAPPRPSEQRQAVLRRVQHRCDQGRHAERQANRRDRATDRVHASFRCAVDGGRAERGPVFQRLRRDLQARAVLITEAGGPSRSRRPAVRWSAGMLVSPASRRSVDA